MNTCDVVTYYYTKRVLYNVFAATGCCGQRGKVLLRCGVYPAVCAISAIQQTKLFTFLQARPQNTQIIHAWCAEVCYIVHYTVFLMIMQVELL